MTFASWVGVGGCGVRDRAESDLSWWSVVPCSALSVTDLHTDRQCL